MQKKKKVSDDSAIKEKIEYLGLNFKKVPKTLIATDNLNFKAFKGYDEKQYKQYKFIKISDIDILLTPTHRLDSINERYDLANPLYMYLDSEQEENADKYATFLRMLKKVEISDVDKVEKEQEMLAKQIPFKVKYSGNYLWQIYYSEYSDKYFMLLPTEDSDYSTFFYLLKKKIENKKDEMIFVPISYLEYSGNILKKSELKDLENYLWLFTRDYPAIYEVFDKNSDEMLQIVGETYVYEKIRSLYKMIFTSRHEATKFYKLLKALFILEIEVPRYFSFTTSIDNEGNLQIALEGKQIKYEQLPEFVASQYKKSVELRNNNEQEIEELNTKLSKLKKEAIKLEKEYLEKEKIISTYLECKKTFFGKVKYFFTMGKKSKKSSPKDSFRKENIEQKEDFNKRNNEEVKVESRNYTLDELILSFKELEIAENSKKNIVQDINAIKLKIKNLKKKIENAILYINEINKHKKSIFEFWKYSNKDEVAALEEGEEEEVNVSKIDRVFNYDNDFVAFGEKTDRNQRLKITDSELDGCFLASTDLLGLINDIYNKKETDIFVFSETLKKLKEQDTLVKEEKEDFDIFGNSIDEDNKERSLGSKIHRETPKSVAKILGIKKGMKGLELKRELIDVAKNIKKALNKNSLNEEICVYKVLDENTNLEGLQVLSLNEKKEIDTWLKNDNKSEKNVYLYKINLPKDTNFIAFSNIVLYNNRNMTLPVGMQESDNILVDMNELKIELKNKIKLNIEYLKNEKNDFSDVVCKTIEVREFGQAD